MGSGETQEISRILGQVEGQLKGLQDGQNQFHKQMREDLGHLHARIQTLSDTTANSISKLAVDGCAKGRAHDDVEQRTRELEAWKTGHEAESRAAATSAGGKSGAVWGGGIAAVVGGILSWLVAHFGGGQGP